MAELQKAKAKKNQETGRRPSFSPTAPAVGGGGGDPKIHLAKDILTPIQQVKLLNAKVQRLTQRCDDLSQELSRKNRIMKKQQDEIESMRRELAAKSASSRLSMTLSKDEINVADLYEEIERLKNDLSAVRMGQTMEQLKSKQFKTEKKKRTKWSTCLDPSTERGKESWASILDFCSLSALGRVSSVCKELEELIASDTMRRTWEDLTCQIVGDTFGEEMVEEVLEFPEKEELKGSKSKIWRNMCKRMRTCHFLGLPAGEAEDDVATSLILDVGIDEIRIGADIKDYASPLVVPLSEKLSFSEKIKRGVEQLMGSSVYMPSTKLWILQSNSLEWRSHKHDILENLFGRFAPLAIAVAPPGVTALFGSGSMTGIVVDIGANFTHIEPVYEGTVLTHASRYLPIGGNTISSQLERHLQSRGYGLAPETIERMKKEVCEVARSSTTIRDMPSRKYQIDEAHVVTVAGAVRSTCAEVLFSPRLAGKMIEGLPEAIHECVSECPIDTRRALMKNIVLIGGVSATPGLTKRVRSELRELESAMDVGVTNPSTTAAAKTSADIDREHQCRWASYCGAWKMMLSDEMMDYVDKTFVYSEDFQNHSDTAKLMRDMLAVHRM